jgi:hypothetical protein
MIHVVRGATGIALRVWEPPDWPSSAVDNEGIAVEWGGQFGHPTSYALLGGHVVEHEPSIVAVDETGPEFIDALPGTADRVAFGLPQQYREAVQDVLGTYSEQVRVTVAAHAAVGSSVIAFRIAADLLHALGTAEAPFKDEATLHKALDEAVARSN